MTDKEIINIGDVCIYSYFEKNRSISIVEVVKELSEETVVIKFHQVIFDNSGNDLFFYLCKTGKTMNASKKYLRKIDLIDRLKAENEEVRKDIVTAEEYAWQLKAKNEALQMDNEQLKSDIINEQMNLEHIQAENERLEQETHWFADIGKMYSEIRAEAIKEFAERLKEYSKCYSYVTPRDIDNLVKEMVGDTDA